MATSGGGLKPQSLKHSARMVYAHHLLDGLADLKQHSGRQDSANLLESEEMLMYLLDRHAERMGVELMLCLAPSYLTQLTLKPSQGLSVCDITRILHKCCHLSALSLENWEELDVGQVVALTRPQLTSLVTLNVGGCEAVADQHVQDLLRLCVNLRHLTLDLTAITDSAFLLHPSRQHHLELTGQQGRGRGRDCGGGSESGWQCGLNHVGVSGCEHFTNTGLLHLASLCGSSLRSLQLHDTQVDFYGLLYLSGHSKLSAKHFLHSLLQAVDTTTDGATATTTLTTSQPGSTDLWRAGGEEEEERAEFPPAVEDHRKGGSIEDREHDNGIQLGERIQRAEGIWRDEGIQHHEGIQLGEGIQRAEGIWRDEGIQHHEGIQLGEGIQRAEGIWHDEGIQHHEGIQLGEGIQRAEGIWCDEGIQHHEGIQLGEGIQRAEGIWRDEGIQHHEGIQLGEGIQRAEGIWRDEGIQHHEGIQRAEGIWRDEGIQHHEGIQLGEGIQRAEGIWRDEGIQHHEGIQLGEGIQRAEGIWRDEGIQHHEGIQLGEGIQCAEGIWRDEGIQHHEGIQHAGGIQHGQASCQTEQTVDQDTGVSLTYLGKPTDSHRSQQNTFVLSSMSQQNNRITKSSMSKENGVTESSILEVNSVTRSSISEENSVTKSSISEENSVTKSSISEENRVTKSSMSEENRVTKSSISEENRVTKSSMSEENRVTKSSISEENRVTKSSMSHEASVTLPSVSQQTKATWTQSSAESAAVQLTSVHSSSHPALSEFAAAPAAWGLCSPPSRPDHHLLPSSPCFHAGASCSGESQHEVADPRQVLLTVADLDSFGVKHQDRQTSGHEGRERPEGKGGQMSGHVELERSESKGSQMSGHMEDLGQDKDSRRSGHKDSEHSGCEDLTRSDDKDCGRLCDKDRNKPVCRSSSGDEKCPCFTDEAASRPEEASLPRPLSPVCYWGPVMKNRKKASCSRTTPSSSPPGLMFRSEVKRVSFSSNLGKVKVKGEGHQLCPLQCFRHFLSANPGLKHLRLQCTVKESEGPLFHEYCQLLVTQVLEAIGEFVPHLQHLAITQEDTGGSYLDDTSVSHLLTRCTHLQSLVISGDAGGLTDKAFEPLQNNSCLEHLSLSPYPITLTTPFFTHPHHPSQLTTLDLTWCEEVQEEQLNQCLILCPFLATLRLRLCKVSSDTLRVIAQHCTAVRHLDISGGQNLQDEAVVCLAHALPDLTSLDVSNNCGVCDDSVQALMMFCPHLETLSLSCLPLLTSLSFVPMVTGDGWKEWIADQLLPSPLSSRPPYASLHHSDQDVRYQLSQRSSDWHRSSNYGGSLKQVDLSYCNRIDDSSLRAVVTVCRGGVQVTNYYKQPMTPYPPLW